MLSLLHSLLAIALHPRIYRLGLNEARAGYGGMTYGHPYTLRSTAYDEGMNQADREAARDEARA
jgi:hypothetical protein